MFIKRIILCFDVIVGWVVKGVNFVFLIDVGDFVEIVKVYNEVGVDEFVFFDIMVIVEFC